MKKQDTSQKDFTLGSTSNMDVNFFIDTNLKLYSAHSNIRGIPFIGDGFKQAQRKAMWGMLERGENADKNTVERIAAAAASCFIGETKVTMSDNTQMSIKDIVDTFEKNKYEVKTFNENTKCFENKTIENAFLTKFTDELLEITLENGETVTCTPDHLFLVGDKWVKASDLICGDNVESL